MPRGIEMPIAYVDGLFINAVSVCFLRPRKMKTSKATSARLSASTAIEFEYTLRKRKIADLENLGRSGGVYVPPFKLARMQKEIDDKTSAEYQRQTWEALRKSINGLVNKVNAPRISHFLKKKS